MSVLKRLIFFLLLMVMGSSVINAQDSTTTVQWDTIMAEILIIESMTAPDSLKQADMVADAVLRGDSAEHILDQYDPAVSTERQGARQKRPPDSPSSSRRGTRKRSSARR